MFKNIFTLVTIQYIYKNYIFTASLDGRVHKYSNAGYSSMGGALSYRAL